MTDKNLIKVIAERTRDLNDKVADAGPGPWWDATMSAHEWFSMPDVPPKEAAMVLCRINPYRDEDPESIHVDGDDSSPMRYRRLLGMFESVARISRQSRTLMDWRAIAQKKGIRYHPWIEEYIKAVAASGRTANRNEELQDAANMLAAQWIKSGRKIFTKREIAIELAKSNDWMDMTAVRIERILLKEW